MSKPVGTQDLDDERAKGSRYCDIFDGLNDAVFIADPDTGVLIDANRQAEALLGRSRAEIIGMHHSELHPAGAADHYRQEFQEQVKAGYFRPDQDGEVVRKDGQIIPVSLSASVITTGRRRLVVGILRDIRQRHQVEREREAIALSQQRTEEALRENQRMLSTLMANLPGMAFRCRNDPDWTMEFISDGCLALTGYKPEDLRHNRVIAYGQVVHPDDRQAVWDQIQAALVQKRPYQIVYRIQTADRQSRWVWEQGRGICGPDGSAQSIEGFTANITSRVEAEDSLRQSEERYRQLVDLSPEAISIHCDGRIVFVNPAYVKLFGASSADEMLGRYVLDLVHPNSRPLVQARMEITRRERILSPLVEQDCLRLDGSVIHVEAMAIPLVYEGRPAAQVIVRDITARKQVQAALDESRRFIRRIVETSPNMIYIFDLQENRHVYMTPAVSRILGFSPEDLNRLGQKEREALLHPEDVSKVVEHLARCRRAQDGEVLDTDYRLRHASGRWVVLHSWDAAFLRNPDGTVRQIIGSAQDVTEQRQAEDALRDSEARYRRLASNAQDMIYRLRVQPEPVFEYISPAVKGVLGYTPQECCSEAGFVVRTTHPDDREQLGEYLAGRVPFDKPFIVRVQRKDKRWVQLEVRNTPICDGAGRIVALEGIARDISERQRAEEAMLERTSLRELSHRILQSQEEERRRLSRELHDEAGQALTAIKLNTELLAKRVPDNLPALKRMAKDTSEVTASLISEMRRIAAALRPAVLDDLGLLPTLRWYAKGIEIRYGLRVKLISRGLKGRLDPSFETTVYRIVQEALTNVVRHAEAKHATVKVTCGKSGLHLLVQDDGRGMDLARIRRGTGLTGVRERAHLYAGTMVLESQPGEGTTLRVEFRSIPEARS